MHQLSSNRKVRDDEQNTSCVKCSCIVKKGEWIRGKVLFHVFHTMHINSSFVDLYIIVKLINKIYQQHMQEAIPNKHTTSLKHAIQAKIIGKQPSKAKFIPIKEEKTVKDSQKCVMPQTQMKLLSSITNHEQKQQPGYFKFQGWLSFHKQMFPSLPDHTVSNFWKILRIINYGQVSLPTGLIYQLFLFIMTKREKKSKSKEEMSLRERINKFLAINKVKDFLNNFRQLSNYPSLEDIQKEYLQTSFSHLPKHNHQPTTPLKQSKLNKQKSSKLFDRLFRESKSKYESKQRLIYQSIAKQMNQCKFKPSISQYQSKQEIKRGQRFCSAKHEKHDDHQKPILQFVARQIDKSIYNGQLNLIYGVQEHIARTKLCEAERQRLQRYFTKPWQRLR